MACRISMRSRWGVEIECRCRPDDCHGLRVIICYKHSFAMLVPNWIDKCIVLYHQNKRIMWSPVSGLMTPDVGKTLVNLRFNQPLVYRTVCNSQCKTKTKNRACVSCECRWMKTVSGHRSMWNSTSGFPYCIFGSEKNGVYLRDEKYADVGIPVEIKAEFSSNLSVWKASRFQT